MSDPARHVRAAHMQILLKQDVSPHVGPLADSAVDIGLTLKELPVNDGLSPKMGGGGLLAAA